MSVTRQLLRLSTAAAVVFAAGLAHAAPPAAPTSSGLIDLTGQARGGASHAAQIEQQKNGDFGKLPRSATPAGQLQKLWDTAPDTAGVRTVPYGADKSYRLTTRIMAVSTIELSRSETIKAVDVPDPNYFDVQPRKPNKIGIIPSLAGIDMTIAIHTESGRTYPVYVRSTDWTATTEPDLILRISLPGLQSIEPAAEPATTEPAPATPGPGAEAETPEAKPDWLTSETFDPATIAGFEHVKMWGDEEIAPVVSWHDDRFTYFYYGSRFKTVDLPIVHRVRDEIDAPVNPRVVGTTLIAEEVAPLFTLQVGQKIVCVHFSDVGPLPKSTKTPAAAPTATRATNTWDRD